MERLKDKKILLVDDEVDLIKVLSWDFEDLGMEVILASGAYEAIDILKKDQNFNFVLSDIKMPNGDGVELLRYIKDSGLKFNGTFLMTGYSDYPEEELYALGMDNLIKKPIDSDLVVEFLVEKLS